MGNKSSVAVIVLNWNGKQDTLDCLATLSRLDYPNFELFVVDNGSEDGSVDAIRLAFPKIHLIETGRNLGYAGGNNVGIRHAVERGFGYFLLLNNDTLCAPGFLSELIAVAEQTPSAALVGPLIFCTNPSDKLWSAGARWNPRSLAFELVTELPSSEDTAAFREVESLVGCALLVRSSAIERLGLLDERYFLMHEESDWCFRARAAGFKCVIARRAIIWHKVSMSFGGADSPLMSYFDERNRLLWASRHLKLRAFTAVTVSRFCEVTSGLLAEFRTVRSSSPRTAYWQLRASLRRVWRSAQNPRLKARAAGFRDFFLRRFGDCPSWVRRLNKTM